MCMCVQGLDKEWLTLTALITHHTVMQEMLPCTLVLPCNATNHLFSEPDDKGEKKQKKKEKDEDYHRVSDFTRIMSDLQI